MKREDWNSEYVGRDEAWTAEPESVLVTEVQGLRLGHALDLGCGAGINAIWLAKMGWQVTGVDWAEAAVEMARITADKEGLAASFIAADITEWKPPRQYDLVVSTYALPSAGRQRKKAINTAIASLAPGGTLLLLEWDVSSPGQRDWDPKDLVSVNELTGYLSELTIDKATTLPVDFEAHVLRDGHGHGDTADRAHQPEHQHHEEKNWVAALVRARRFVETPKS
ncbi:MAG: class I SAM-dependent methyltransferase [Chloroflexi bacterium]|nr:class I SAM-dependent methyltransferase [Chloroflexota bacterium]MDA1270345.1 class I SAM-dependent methyltransferase [Chloroflexota bacterium]